MGYTESRTIRHVLLLSKKMRQPQIIASTEVFALGKPMTLAKSGKWIPARPISYQYSMFRNLKNRLRLAWLVFTGRCDVLDWLDNK